MAANKALAEDLVRACYDGHLAKAQQLLPLVGSTEYHDDFGGNTPLIAASMSGCRLLVEWLLRNGANRAATNTNGSTCLHMAAEYNRVEVAAALIDAGLSVDCEHGFGGGTPLFTAVRCPDDSRMPMVELLLERGADVNARTGGGETPLFSAAGPKSVARLIEAGAQVDARSEAGLTALQRVLRTTPKSTTIAKIKLLAKAGADLDAGTEEGKTLLSLAKKEGRQDVVDLLISLGCRDAKQQTH